MAIVVQSYTVDKSLSGTSLIINKPAGVVSGDLLLLLCSNDSIADTDQFNAVSGWTKEFEIGDSTADTHMALYSRIADGTEGASFTVTMAVSEYALSWCLRIDGHSTSTPIDVIGTETIVANGSSITCPAVTTTEDGCLAIAWATEGNGNAHPYTVNSGTGWPSTIPGDETGDTDQEYASSASQAGVFLTNTIASAGSSNQIIFDISGATTYGKCGIQFAVRPAVAGEMATNITGASTVSIILGATIPFSSDIAIQNSTPFGGTPVYTELATKIGYLRSFTQSVTVPEGDNRMVILAHAHWDNERLDADGSATYDGNAMTPLRTASTSMTMYYYLLGDGLEETKNIIWTAGADGNQFQTNIMSVITEIQQTTPIIYHDSDRADPHASPYEHSLTVTAHKDYVILTFESNSVSSATFLKASSSDDFTIKRTHFGSLSSSGLGYKEYTAATANQSYIWDTLSSNIPTQNVNQFEIVEGGIIDMVAIILEEGAGGPTVLVVQDSSHTHTSENVTLTQANTLAAQSTTHNHTVDNVVLTGLGIDLVVQDSSHNHTAESPVLGLSLLIQDTTHNHTADNIALVEQELLTVQNTTHNHTVDTIIIVQAHILIVVDSSHTHTSENVDLVQSHILAINDTTHPHTADNTILSVALNLVVQDTTHNHTVENVVLVSQDTLIVADTTHNHTVDSTVLVQQSTLTVENTTHSHTVDSVILKLTITVQDSNHNHTVDNIVLVQTNVLVTADTTHTQLVDNVILSIALTVSDTTHNHTADNIDLIQTFLLVSNDTTHPHTVDNVLLTLPGFLAVNDSSHTHTVEIINLGTALIVNSTIHTLGDNFFQIIPHEYKFTNMIAKFNTGETVTIQIYNLETSALEVDTTMVEIGVTGYYKYKYEGIKSSLVDYLVIMSNGTSQQAGKLIFRTQDLIGSLELMSPSSELTDIGGIVWDTAAETHGITGTFGALIQSFVGYFNNIISKLTGATSRVRNSTSGGQENQK